MGEAMFVDEFLPVFDFSDTIETAVAADTATTWQALMEAESDRGGPGAPAGRAAGGRADPSSARVAALAR